MTNEEILIKIKNSENSKEYLQMLYDNNLPSIKAICRKYTPYCEMDDLLQESFFGLLEAVSNYDSFKEVKFWTYCSWWIRQAVIRYVEKNATCLYIPINFQESIWRYKKCISEHEKNNGKTPNRQEIAKIMGISIKKVAELERMSQPITSMDMPIENGENSLCDVIVGANDTETEVIEDIHEQQIKKILWSCVDNVTDEKENYVLKEYFVNGKAISKIAEELGLSSSRVRCIKEKALQKMSRTKIKRHLSNNLEVYESRMYHTGVRSFRISLTSATENIAMQLQA